MNSANRFQFQGLELVEAAEISAMMPGSNATLTDVMKLREGNGPISQVCCNCNGIGRG